MADIRGRRPDGVETGKTEAAPLVGKAANEAQDRVEVKNQPPFPGGLKALEDRQPREDVSLINFQLGRGFYTVIDWAKPERAKGGGRPTKVIQVGPFQPFTVKVQDARKLLELYGPEINPAGTPEDRLRKIKIIVAPPKGDCGGKMTMHVPALRGGAGLEIDTCPYLDCPHHRHDPKPWSIYQAQAFIMRTKQPSVIEDFMNAVDSRREVMFFGTQMAALRRQRKLERMGVGAPASGRVF